MTLVSFAAVAGQANACEKLAVSEAVTRVNNEMFTAIHRARTGVDRPVYNAWLG